jgi:hypothetical protein
MKKWLDQGKVAVGAIAERASKPVFGSDAVEQIDKQRAETLTEHFETTLPQMRKNGATKEDEAQYVAGITGMVPTAMEDLYKKGQTERANRKMNMKGAEEKDIANLATYELLRLVSVLNGDSAEFQDTILDGVAKPDWAPDAKQDRNGFLLGYQIGMDTIEEEVHTTSGPKKQTREVPETILGFEMTTEGTVVVSTTKGEEEMDGMELLARVADFHYGGATGLKLKAAFLKEARRLELLDENNRFDPIRKEKGSTKPTGKRSSGWVNN